MCGKPEFKGDGNCDDNNNNDACDYDGGDCCPKTVKNKKGFPKGKVKTKFCSQVGVKTPYYIKCNGRQGLLRWPRLGNGILPRISPNGLFLLDKPCPSEIHL